VLETLAVRKNLITSLAFAALSGVAFVAVTSSDIASAQSASAEDDLVIRKGTVVGSSGDKQAAEATGPASAASKSAAAPKPPRDAKPLRDAQRIVVERREGQSLAAAWDAWFANWSKRLPKDEAAAERVVLEFERDLRETARRLVAEGKYEEAVAAFEAAMRNGEPRPWMYEALSVAMQAAGASDADLERALMSAADLASGDVDHYLYLAHYMARVGLDRRALAMFREVAELDPSRTDALVAAMSTAERLGDADALRWATVAVLSQEWTNKERDVAQHALRQAQSMLGRLRKEDPAEAAAYQQEIDEARARDVVIRVSWTGDADVDISVLEPTGTVCSFRQPRTTGGGVILGDTFSRDNVAAAEGYTETYVCPRAFAGDYQLMLRKVWGKVTAGQVKVEVITKYGTKEKHIAPTTVQLADGTNAIQFHLEEGRREEPVQDLKVANAIREQAEMGRHILAQQLGGVLDPRAIAAAQAARLGTAAGEAGALNGVGGLLPIPIPIAGGAVGFRPVITKLPEGANLAANAVISADRRYVRISAMPLFSKVGKVLAFNIITGQITEGNPDFGNGGGGGTGGGGAPGGGPAR
jgi:tetratricopeptide (TPR) repeat protein